MRQKTSLQKNKKTNLNYFFSSFHSPLLLHRNFLAASGFVFITSSISSMTSGISFASTPRAPKLSSICDSEVAPRITVETLAFFAQKAMASCASEQFSFEAIGRRFSTFSSTSGASSFPASMFLYLPIDRREPAGMVPLLPYLPVSTPEAIGDQIVVPVPRVSKREKLALDFVALEEVVLRLLATGADEAQAVGDGPRGRDLLMIFFFLEFFFSFHSR